MKPDGSVVVDDGKQTGVIFCGVGSTVDDAVAKQYGIAVDKKADTSPTISAGGSGQMADAAAVAGAAQTAGAIGGKTDPLTPAPGDANAPPQAPTTPVVDVK